MSILQMVDSKRYLFGCSGRARAEIAAPEKEKRQQGCRTPKIVLYNVNYTGGYGTPSRKSLAKRNQCHFTFPVNQLREHRGNRSWNCGGRCGSPTKAAPGEAGRYEEQCSPKQKRQAKLKEDAESKSGRREDGADPLNKGISKLKEETRKIGL